MIQNAFFITVVIFLALASVLLEECKFLIPYRDLLVYKYGVTILIFSAVLFLNVFMAVYLACRKLFLKDTGRKLAHIDRQLRSGDSITDELKRLLED